MNLEKTILDFYKDVYKDFIVCDGNLLGFENKILNHPVLTPYFVLNQEFNDIKPWLNIFDSQDKGDLETKGYKKDYSYQFIALNKPIKSITHEFDFSLLESESHSINEARELLANNAVELSIETQLLLEQVFEASRGKFKRLVALEKKENRVVGTLSILESSHSCLLVNGCVDKDFRGQGVFKAMLSQVTNIFLSETCKTIFYWTFNPLLQNRGDENKWMSVYLKR